MHVIKGSTIINFINNKMPKNFFLIVKIFKKIKDMIGNRYRIAQKNNGRKLIQFD